MRPSVLGLSMAMVAMTAGAQAQPEPPASAPVPWTGIARADLLRQDVSAAGREVIQVRVDFEPGASAPRHRHPGEEIVYVLRGSLEYRLDGRAPVTVAAGEALFIPDGVVHAVRNAGRDSASELATYLVRKGEPLLVPAG